MWVVFNPERKPGDGAKPQDIFLPRLYSLLDEITNAGNRKKVCYEFIYSSFPFNGSVKVSRTRYNIPIEEWNKYFSKDDIYIIWL